MQILESVNILNRELISEYDHEFGDPLLQRDEEVKKSLILGDPIDQSHEETKTDIFLYIFNH